MTESAVLWTLVIVYFASNLLILLWGTRRQRRKNLDRITAGPILILLVFASIMFLPLTHRKAVSARLPNRGLRIKHWILVALFVSGTTVLSLCYTILFRDERLARIMAEAILSLISAYIIVWLIDVVSIREIRKKVLG